MSIKRTIITAIAVLALVVTVAPAVQADTLSDLMAQIATLQAQIARLQGGSTATVTGACVGVTFNRNLTVGSTGSDVSCLQQILSVTPMSGYFGPKTLAAVRSYQTAHGWTPANQVGPMTRQALNASFGNGTTTTTTGLPAGCTSTSGYSPVTGASCASTTTITTVGATGYLTVAGLSASPASNASVTTTTNVPVLGVDVRATGSDMVVTSAEVQLTTVKFAIAGEHPATAIKNLYVYDGSTLLGTYPVNTSTVLQSSSNSSTYYMILSGFRFVAPVNTTKSLTVVADFTPGLETSRVVTVNLYDQGLRAVDGSGASSNTITLTGTTIVSGFITTAATYSRQYTIAYATVGIATLSVTTSTSTPIASTVNVNHTSGTTDVPMAVFTAHSITGPSTITSMKFTVQGDNGNIARVNALKLYDGSTLLGSQSLVGSTSGAYATFSNISIPVAQDAYKALTVKADFVAGVTADAIGERVVILDPATDIAYQTPNLSSSNPTAIAAVQGNYMHVFDGVSPDLSFTSATATYTPVVTSSTSSSYSTGVITFRVHANGGTVTALTSSTVTAKYNGTTVSPVTLLNVDFAPVGGTDGADLQDGGDAIVTVSVTEPRSTTGSGFVNFSISQIVWLVGDTSITQTWGLGDYKTPYVNAQ
jgi:hypothetical protein